MEAPPDTIQFTLATNSEDEYCVFTTLDYEGNLRMSGWMETEQEALEYLGDDCGDSIDADEIEEGGYEIVRTFSPSDYMKECGQKNTKEIKAAIETLKKAGMIVDGKILNLS
jgi:hypothetical protein